MPTVVRALKVIVFPASIPAGEVGLVLSVMEGIAFTVNVPMRIELAVNPAVSVTKTFAFRVLPTSIEFVVKMNELEDVVSVLTVEWVTEL